MKTMNGMIFALAAVALLAAGWSWAADPVAAVSDEISLDTRSYTEACSPPHKLSTKKIKGTMISMR